MIDVNRDYRATDTLLMVRPHDFGFNEETGLDNDFQQRHDDGSDVRGRAMHEFAGMVDRLRQEGVEVLILEASPNSWVKTPDAVFPNNWFATERDGTIVSFPMLAENRRAEKRLTDIEDLLCRHGFYIRNLINVGRYGERQLILEGTGSMVIDHSQRRIYAAVSQRCHPKQLHNYMQLRDYDEAVVFETRASTGRPVYHTNVLMSVGERFAVICSQCIANPVERDVVLSRLRERHEVIEITLEQMESHFCGNILQVRNHFGEPLIVMSQRAFNGFSQTQRHRLSQHGRLVPVDIGTIEEVGGGSARCMMAEIFLPRAQENQMAG